MEGKKLKYPRKVRIETAGMVTQVKHILDFAEKHKRGSKAQVVLKNEEFTSFGTGNRIPRAIITFWTYEPIGLLRDRFRSELWKTDFVGGIFVEGWLFRFPNIKERWHG